MRCSIDLFREAYIRRLQELIEEDIYLVSKFIGTTEFIVEDNGRTDRICVNLINEYDFCLTEEDFEISVTNNLNKFKGEQ